LGQDRCDKSRNATTNGKAHAACFLLAPEQFLGVCGLAGGRCAFSCIHLNASTHGPPTSNAVLVNFEKAFLLTDLEARLHPALLPHSMAQLD